MRTVRMLACLVVLVSWIAAAGKVAADTIYLKNGGVIEGKIIRDWDGKIKVRTAGRAILVYNKSDIEKIEYDEKTGEDYLKRKSGVKGGKSTNPFKPKTGGEGVAEGENPYEDKTEVTEEEQQLIDKWIRDIVTRHDNRYLIRAKTKLTAMGYKAGKSLVDVIDAAKMKSRLRIVEILRDINYKPAVPHLIAKSLRDENPFTREAAIQALEKMTGNAFGYRSQDPVSLRERSIAKWEDWWMEEEAKYLPEETEEEGAEGEGEEGEGAEEESEGDEGKEGKKD